MTDDCEWYAEDARPEDFWAWSDDLCKDAGDRRSMAEAALTVYHGREFSFGGPDNPTSLLAGLMGGDLDTSLEPIGYNVVASVSDTMAGHILRNKVRPQFVTEKGSVEAQRNAIGMQRAIEGEFHNGQIYGPRAGHVCYRGLNLQAGGVKVVADYPNRRPDFQTVWAHEFFVPREESYRDCNHTMVHQFDMSRAALRRMFADDEEALKYIKASPTYTGVTGKVNPKTSDRILVREAWHLPTLDPDLHEDHDGVRILACEGGVLERSEYKRRKFPVAWFKPMPIEGEFWSRGYPERLSGAQQKLNEYQERIDAILNLHARPLLITWARAGISRSKITNAVANILTSKVPPSQALWQMTPQAVPRELVERVQAIIAWAEKQAGVSELSISAQKPAGIEHAPALRHLADTEAVRHTLVFNAWERFHLDLAEITVDTLRDLVEECGGDYKTIFADNQELIQVEWSKVDLGRDRYVTTCWPTNLLPSTPSAKVATLVEMVENKMLSPAQAMSRFENPDVRDLLGDQGAAAENIERVIQDAIDGKPNAVPHPYMDLALLQIKVKERINRLQANNEDAEVIDRVINLFSAGRQLELMLMAETANASAPGGQAAAPPPAAPPPGPAPAGPPPA